MQHERFELPALSAGVDQLALDLYSQQHIDSKIKNQLTSLLMKHLEGENNIKILIVGGRCGLTTEILLPICSQIDVVEQEPYFNLLEQRFNNLKEVDYFFGKEGEIGSRFILPKVNKLNKNVRIISSQEFLTTSELYYDLVVLQNWIINDKLNVVKEFLKIKHKLLISMIVPGKIEEPRIFAFLSDLEKYTLRSFYENIFHQTLKYQRHLTGRVSQILYHQVFGWKKNSNSQQIQDKIKQTVDSTLSHYVDGVCHCKQEKNRLLRLANHNESPQYVNRQVNFHYGLQENENVNYQNTLAQICCEIGLKQNINGRALDLGCSVGRTTIDLAKQFTEVVGIDKSKAFIHTAKEKLVEFPNAGSKVNFIVSDACQLNKQLGKFEIILVQNIIDRVSDPTKLLTHLKEFLSPNGVLIISSSYSWLESITQKQKWLGGFIENGLLITTQAGLKRTLYTLGLSQLKQNQNICYSLKQNQWVFKQIRTNLTFWVKDN